MGPDAMIFVFWMLICKPAVSLSSFTFIKRLFSSSSLSAIRVVSSAYLRLLIFLPAILIPAWASTSLEFRMMYSASKLNKQGNNTYSLEILLFQFWIHLFPCPALTVASSPAYRSRLYPLQPRMEKAVCLLYVCMSLYRQQKQDQELTVVQIINSWLQNSDLSWGK